MEKCRLAVVEFLHWGAFVVLNSLLTFQFDKIDCPIGAIINGHAMC